MKLQILSLSFSLPLYLLSISLSLTVDEVEYELVNTLPGRGVGEMKVASQPPAADGGVEPHCEIVATETEIDAVRVVSPLGEGRPVSGGGAG